ncbi:uncharacterized protein B0I36DRAFT_381391 [Microdochium trichocladiopsis]|uniref:Zn(2)-C6 fungal-type domain-containing protein n=1 Tax=Microdochium trichocladiopsis TaxID=1682393 RepID=A0A9P8YFH6_9PEZI|nr:uncharacterized protein B0I36DRAFT_381391 [Microdochium trichocladiopsis]KAH7038373.1 hypothetical protein B0I36DRAFT_381391 [Microdochium trichocladiopsis]
MGSGREQPARRTRNRSTLSCESCRKRKAKCDRKHPCTNCVRWQAETCVYSSSLATPGSKGDGSVVVEPAFTARLPTHRRIAPLTLPNQEPGAGEASSAAGPKPQASTRTRDVTTGGIHVWRSTPLASIFIGISEPASSTSRTTNKPRVANASKDTEAAVYDRDKDVALQEPLFPALEGTSGPIRGAFYKNRYIGQSHWMYAWPLYPPALAIVGTEMTKKGASWKAFQDCKALARLVKSQKPPSSARLSCTDFGRHLPSYALAVAFLDGYLETFETVYRIFMVPTLKRDFDSMWDRGAEDQPASRETVIQVQLCLAIGATAGSEGSSLRPLITQWVSEGCAWAAHSTQKAKLSITGLQILCLLHIARQACAIEADLSWIPAGSLIRTAMCMGFHIDPSMLPAMPAADVELRRRLWATVLEIVLESSISAGAPPLISAEDVGCKFPSNCNDDELVAQAAVDSHDAVPQATRPTGEYTDTSAQIALAKSFKARLAIVKTINQPNVAMATSYDDLMTRSTRIDEACQQLRSDLAHPKATPFQRKYCSLMLERYYLVIHISYLSLAYQKNRYAARYSLSRTTCVDTALRVMYAGLTPASAVFKKSPLSALMTCSSGTASPADTTTCQQSEEYFPALLQRGGGHLRSIPLQCILVLALELITRTAGNDNPRSCSLGHPSPAAPAAGGGGGGGVGGGGAMLSAALSHPPGTTGQFESLRDVEVHLLLRVGAEWTARRVSVAGDMCAKDHAFVALLVAIAEGQICRRAEGGGGGLDKDEADVVVRERYCAAFEECRELLIQRLRAGGVGVVAAAGEESVGHDHVEAANTLADLDGRVAEDVMCWSGYGEVDMAEGDMLNGFWMGDVSDDLDWDGIMDFTSF